MDGDIVIRGGSLIDGTGAPARPADVAVADGRIVGVGEGLRGERELDASGQVLDGHRYGDSDEQSGVGVVARRIGGAVFLRAQQPCAPGLRRPA